MSFDFDPNKNIDRAEDDNDPQDIENLVGGEGLYGRVPGGPQVGAAIDPRDKPMVANPQVIKACQERQGQAQARGGLGQAQGGQALWSARQAPGLLGMLGRVPSQVSLAASAASASVIPISGYFGTQKRQVIEINAHRVICPKHA
jgi:hypothetical protein